MNFQFGNERMTETLISRITIINPSSAPVPLPMKYRRLFHGATHIKYGRHIFRFPIDNMNYKRLVTSFQNEFMGRIFVDFGASGIDEV